MADEALVFDAAGSNIDGTNPGASLAVGPGTSYNLVEHEYPAAPQSVMYASSIDTEGELAVTSRYGNRTLRIKLDMVDASGTLLAALQAKYAKLQREGGTLKRTMKNGDVRIYDVVAADGLNPAYDFAYYLGDLVQVDISLPARPMSRGAEVDLGDNVETTLPVLIFTEASVLGDVPALGRLVIDEDQSQDQKTVFWGIQSRYYDSASTAALFYQGESFSPNGSGAVGNGSGTVSGGGSNNIIENLNLTGTLSPFATLANLTHVGSFQVLARVRTSQAGTISLGARWKLRSGESTQNAVVDITSGLTGAWHLIDLGQITASKPTKGSQSLQLDLMASSTTVGDDIGVDWVALIPISEGSGVAFAPSDSNVYPLPASAHAELRHDTFEYSDGTGTYWGRPAYEGDYLLVPPSGAEARTLRVFLKASRAVQDATTREIFASDTAIDDISARLYITPRFLT